MDSLPNTSSSSVSVRNRQGQSTQRFPEPVVFEPLRGPHNLTLIILHGRGSNADAFSSELMRTPIASYKHYSLKMPTAAHRAIHAAKQDEWLTLATALPHAKFVFPSAAFSRATVWGRTRITQWFDNWSHDAPFEREELQIDGLRETVFYLHGLVKQEAEELQYVGSAKRVVLGGLSQGGAASLVASMLWEGHRFGAVFGLCTYLPFRRAIEDGVQSVADLVDDMIGSSESLTSGETAGNTDLFSTNYREEIEEYRPAAQRGISELREILEIPAQTLSTDIPLSQAFQGTPVFLAHGVRDGKVYLPLGHGARGCLQLMDAKVQLREYEELGHWYSPQMLGDLTTFLAEEGLCESIS